MSSEHQKTAKKKNNIIEDLMKYKADKCSEERDLKIKQRKLNKKLKQVEERECKLRTAKNNLNRKEVDEADADNNNDIVQNQTKPSLASNSRLFTTAVTYSIPRDSSSSHSMVSRWLPVHMNKFDRSDPSSKSYTGNRQGLTSTKLNSSDHNSTLDFLNTTTLFSDLELLKTIIEKFAAQKLVSVSVSDWISGLRFSLRFNFSFRLSFRSKFEIQFQFQSQFQIQVWQLTKH